MKIFASICFILTIGWFIATTSLASAPYVPPCTPEWFVYLENQYFSNSEGEAHAPNSDSREWLNAFEARLKLPSTSPFPEQQRCQLIQDHLEHRTYIINRQLGLAQSF